MAKATAENTAPTPAELRAAIKARLADVQRKSENVELVPGVTVEVRELTWSERNEILRSTTAFAETKDGRDTLKRFGITDADYQNIGLVIECAYIPGTNERVWTSRREIPEVVGLGSTIVSRLQRAAFTVCGINLGAEVTETQEETAEDPELTAEEKNF